MPARLAFAALAALALTACGGGGEDPAERVTHSPAARPTATPSRDDSPCRLLTPAEVSAAVGAKVGNGRAAAGTIASRTCTWTTTAAPRRTVTLEVTTDDDIPARLKQAGQTPRTMFDTLLAAYPTGTIEELKGIGHEAYRAPSKVFFRVTGAFAIVSTAPDNPKAGAGLEALARDVAAKLG